VSILPKNLELNEAQVESVRTAGYTLMTQFAVGGAVVYSYTNILINVRAGGTYTAIFREIIYTPYYVVYLRVLRTLLQHQRRCTGANVAGEYHYPQL